MTKTVALIHFNHMETDGKVTWADMGVSDARPNYGDMLVCASLLQHLDGDVTTFRRKFGKQVDQACDVALVRGSTYIHHRFDFNAANETLASIDAPLAIVGLGAQSPKNDPTFLDDNAGARDFIAILNEKSQSISVRGSFTAEVVTRLGAKNVRITGCPSLFYSNAIPQVSLSPLLETKHRRLAVSLHSGLRQSIYCRDPENARLKHTLALRYAIDNSSKASFFEQGVKMEFDIADHRLPYATRLERAAEMLDRIKGTDLITPESLIAGMVSVRSIDEWLAKIRDVDAAIGFRFHGNMIALLQGIPCYYWTYDSRLKEFCELYNLPMADVATEWADPVNAMLEHDWAAANRSINNCHTELKAFYAENGFPTIL